MKLIRTTFLFITCILLVLSSCTIEKRVHSPGFHVEWKSFRHDPGTQAKAKAPAPVSEVQPALAQPEVISAATNPEDPEAIIPSYSPVTPEYAEQHTTMLLDTPEKCDQVLMGTGEEIAARVIESKGEEVKYKKCDHIDGPTYRVRRAEVFMIKYADGTKEVITPAGTPKEAVQSETPKHPGLEADRKTQGLGLAGFIISILGFFIAGIPLGILAIIFGAISLGKIKRYPEKFKGKGFAIAALIIGIVDIVGAIAAAIILSKA